MTSEEARRWREHAEALERELAEERAENERLRAKVEQADRLSLEIMAERDEAREHEHRTALRLIEEGARLEFARRWARAWKRKARECRRAMRGMQEERR